MLGINTYSSVLSTEDHPSWGKPGALFVYTPAIRDSGRLTPLTSHSDANNSKRVGDPDE